MSQDYMPTRSSMSRSAKMRASQQAAERESSSLMMQQQQMSRAQQQAVLTGSVAILWDMENCPVPSEVKADDVAGNIRQALRTHPVIQGAVTLFSAYGDFNHFPRKVREGCQRTGVNLIDVPNGKKDASDKAILVDLFLFALDNAPPCTIFLISGDVDFAPALHKLGQRGYTVVLAIPSGVGVSSALCSAGRYVWDWPSVARGGGLVLVPAKNFSSSGARITTAVDDRMAEIIDMTASSGPPPSSRRSSVDERIADLIELNVPAAVQQPISSSSRMRNTNVDERRAEIIEMNASAGQPPGAAWSHDEDSDLASDDVPCDDEQIVWKSPAPPPLIVDHHHPALDGSSVSNLSVPQPGIPGPSSGDTAASGNPPAHKEQSNDSSGDAAAGSSVSVPKGSSKSNVSTTPIENLQKEQLVRLVGMSGSKSMELSRVPAEYQKHYGKPLFSGDSTHSHNKLMNLLERFKDLIFTRGEGAARTVHLTKGGSRLAGKLKRDAKNEGRGAPKEGGLEVVNAFRIDVEDAAELDDETVGEEVIVVGCPTKGMQTLITDVQSLLNVKDPQMSQGERRKELLEEIHLPNYDWDFGSGGSGGSGDEKDNLLEEKDVEVDESTLEQVLKPKGNVRAATELEGLDVFRLELQDLLVSHACKIVVSDFIKFYLERYTRGLDYEKFGVKDLESLIEKVSDVAVIMYEPESKLKYLVARWSHDGVISDKIGESGDTPELL
ncbi:unnamed protein product [Calypogeia fissa]